MPGDHSNGSFKKVLNLNEAISFVVGQRHAFCHPVKHFNVDKAYNIISKDAEVNHKVLFPGDTVVKQPGNPMIYTYAACNDSFYQNSNFPVVHSFVKAPQPGSESYIKDHRVALPEDCFQRTWHVNKPNLDTEKGCDVPLDTHVKSSYQFADSFYHHRATTFSNSGLFFGLQQTRSCAMKFTLMFDITPIVPLYTSNKEIPYTNLRRCMKCQLHETKLNV